MTPEEELEIIKSRTLMTEKDIALLTEDDARRVTLQQRFDEATKGLSAKEILGTLAANGWYSQQFFGSGVVAVHPIYRYFSLSIGEPWLRVRRQMIKVKKAKYVTVDCYLWVYPSESVIDIFAKNTRS